MRTSLLLLIFPMFALAQTPTLNPLAPVATVGQSTIITSSTNVTWSLAGTGTLSNQTPTSVTYTAPASVVPQAQMLGCPVLPNDSVFNTRIDNLPVDANSSTWNNATAGNMSASGINFLPSWGITYADSTTPLAAITPYYGDNLGNNPTYSIPIPNRNLIKRENGSYNSGHYTGNDHHTVTVQTTSCTFYEYYNESVPNLLPTINCRYTSAPCNASSAIYPYGSASFVLPTVSTDAAGLPLAPLTWTLADIKSGPKHPVRFTASIGYINGSEWPAGGSNASHPNSPPYGSRWRLKTTANGGPNVTTICTANSVLNQDCVNMLTGLQQYGMILADIGGNNQIEISSDTVSDPVTRAAMAMIQGAKIGVGSFDAVNESSLQETSANNYQVPSFGSFAVDPSNGYVTPLNYAVITATPSSGSPAKVSVGLEGIGIGLNSSAMAIAVGMSGYQIPSWVTGSSNQNVTWSLASGVGTVTANGVYTPPATTANGTTAVLQATAQADTNVSVYLYVSVLTNNSGTYSIDFAAPSPTTSPGKTWNNDFGVEVSTPNFYLGDYPTWQNPIGTNIPEYLQYGSLIYTYGGDIRYSMVLPNGNYKVRWMLGQEWYACPCTGTRSTFPQTLATAPSFFDVNGVTEAHYYDWNFAAGYNIATPTDLYVPAKVTNNVLTVGDHAIAPDETITAASGIAPLYAGAFPHFLTTGLVKSSQASAIEIIPDATAPHWAIETQQMKQIAPGGAIQLFVVDWYTGDLDVTTPTWSIVTGPPAASISSSGLLTLGTGTNLGNQAITVQAKGAIHSATTTLYTTGAAQWAINPIPHFSRYAYTRTLTIDHTQVAAPLTNFPVTVILSDPALATMANGGHVQNPNGYDIIVTSDSAGKSPLPWELEKYDPVNGVWIGHIQVPSVSNTTDTVLYVFYSNPAILSSQATGNVWDSNFTAVYHLSSLSADSTLNDNTASPQSSYTTEVTGGKIAGAANFSAAIAYISTTPSVLNGPKGTLSAWVYSTGNAGNLPYEFANEQDNTWRFDFFVLNSPPIVGWSSGQNDYRFPVTTTVGTNAWHHLVYSWDLTVPAQYAYIDGIPVGSDTTTQISPAPTGSLLLNGQLNYNMAGTLDEVRISNIARSAAWIETEYLDTDSPSTFATLGAETSN